jgi:hypothetical protein
MGMSEDNVSPFTTPIYWLCWRNERNFTGCKAEATETVLGTLQIGQVLTDSTEMFLRPKQRQFFRSSCATSHQTQVYSCLCWLHVEMRVACCTGVLRVLAGNMSASTAYMHTYTHTHTNTHTYVGLHTYVHTYTYVHTHTYINTYIILVKLHTKSEFCRNMDCILPLWFRVSQILSISP